MSQQWWQIIPQQRGVLCGLSDLNQQDAQQTAASNDPDFQFYVRGTVIIDGQRKYYTNGAIWDYAVPVMEIIR
jgi:hypothetical protein